MEDKPEFSTALELTPEAPRTPSRVNVQPGSMLEAVMRAAADPNVEPARLRELLAIGRELETDRARTQFNVAFEALKDDVPDIEKRGVVLNKAGRKQFKFARYDDLHRALKPLLKKHGFSTSFSFEEPEKGRLTCVLELLHNGGFSKFYRWTLPAMGENQYVTNLQNASAAKSFAKRNVLIDALDILTVDSDRDGADVEPPEVITEDQARQIEDMVAACAQREKNFTERFLKWVRAEIQIDQIRDLRQGVQRDSVVLMLKAKMAGLGIQ